MNLKIIIGICMLLLIVGCENNPYQALDNYCRSQTIEDYTLTCEVSNNELYPKQDSTRIECEADGGMCHRQDLVPFNFLICRGYNKTDAWINCEKHLEEFNLSNIRIIWIDGGGILSLSGFT